MRKAENRTVAEFSKEKEGSWNGKYVFVHAADPQFGFMDERTGGKGLIWDEEINLLQKAISATNQMVPKPRFFFVNGDLVNAYPGCGAHKDQQEKDLIQTLSKSKIPVLVTSGNHDIGLTPTSETVKNFTSAFGDDYFSFYVGGVFYIALNSQYFFDSSETKKEAGEQTQWLDKQLQKAKDEGMNHIVVFMHIPLFVSEPNEFDRPCNIPTEERMRLLNKFADAGVETVFSGHYHRNGGGLWERSAENTKDAKIEVVVTSAIGMPLGNDKSGLSVVTVEKDGISQQYYAVDNIPQQLC